MSDSLDFDNLFAETPTASATTVEAAEPIDLGLSADTADTADDGDDEVGNEAVADAAVDAAPARADRVDWKERAIREEEQRKALQTQLDALRAAPAQQQQPQQLQPREIPNPMLDPAGYHAYQEDQAFQRHLHMSEWNARRDHPDIDDALKVFQAEAAVNPAITRQIAIHPHPWEWMYQEAQRIKATKEIGGDPNAWREREREKLRAEILAEGGAQGKSAQRAPVQLPPNLTGMRSVAARGDTAYTGLNFDTLIPDIPTYEPRTRH